LLTARVGFAAVDTGTDMQVMVKGVGKATLALWNVILVPFELVVSSLIARWVVGDKPLAAWMRLYPLRLALGAAFAALLLAAPTVGVPVDGASSSGSGSGSGATVQPAPPPWLGPIFVTLMIAHALVVNGMFMALVASFNRVADPLVGGAVMTLCNTLSNLGSMWPGPSVLWAMQAWDADAAASGLDGYTAAVVLTTAVGVAWWGWNRGRMRALEALPRTAWLVRPPTAPPAPDDDLEGSAPASAATSPAPLVDADGDLASDADEDAPLSPSRVVRLRSPVSEART
jgi:hypothetical protein